MPPFIDLELIDELLARRLSPRALRQDSDRWCAEHRIGRGTLAQVREAIGLASEPVLAAEAGFQLGILLTDPSPRSPALETGESIEGALGESGLQHQITVFMGKRAKTSASAWCAEHRVSPEALQRVLDTYGRLPSPEAVAGAAFELAVEARHVNAPLDRQSRPRIPAMSSCPTISCADWPPGYRIVVFPHGGDAADVAGGMSDELDPVLMRATGGEYLLLPDEQAARWYETELELARHEVDVELYPTAAYLEWDEIAAFVIVVDQVIRGRWTAIEDGPAEVEWLAGADDNARSEWAETAAFDGDADESTIIDAIRPTIPGRLLPEARMRIPPSQVAAAI